MKQIKSLLAFCLFYILAFTTIHAQSISFASNNTIQSATLISGYYTKSVLLSNLLSDRVGDISPVIGAADWTDNGQQLKCKSLLEFNYLAFPKIISENPGVIISAELILFPLQVAFSDSDVYKPSKFMVSRVLETWQDTAAQWINQPAVDISSQVVRIIKMQEKNQPVNVDVTRLVKDMLLFGNNGFMISQDNSPENSMAFGQLFASPKNEDKNLHPQLFIKYAENYNTPSIKHTFQSATEFINEFNRNHWDRTGIIPLQQAPQPYIRPPVRTVVPSKLLTVKD